MRLREPIFFIVVIGLAVARFILTANDGPITMVSPPPIALGALERTGEAVPPLQETGSARTVEEPAAVPPSAEPGATRTRAEEPPERRVPQALFEDAGSGARERVSSWTDKRSVLRERLVRVDLGRLGPRPADPTSISRPVPEPLRFDLFEDASFEVVLDRLDPLSAKGSGLIWLGHVAGLEHSSVTLAIQGPAVQALVQLPSGQRFEVTYAGRGVHRILELDPAAFPPEEEPQQAEGSFDPSEAEPLEPGVAAADGSTIVDLMVLYTPAARDAAGGQDALEARIQQAVSVANQAYQNSLVAIRHRLVHMALVSYVEPSTDAFYTALDHLTDPNDGIMDPVHAVRDAHGADVVSLLIDSWNYCGMAWVNDPHQGGAGDWAFNVNLWYCVGSTRTLQHEIGHNQGLAHDIDNARVSGSFPYSHGLQVDGQFHTVMAYDQRFGCAAPCPAINHFSNPLVPYQETPTGSFSQADNARSLTETRAFVANWRTPPDCSDGMDNDEDGWVDVPEDPGCSAADDLSERPACSDGFDNDGDGWVDSPDDPGCEAPDDGSETMNVDADGDGVSDDRDNCLTIANPDQRDTQRDGYGNACDADLDDNGVVGLSDFALLSVIYGSRVGDPDYSPHADLNGDDAIGLLDFATLGRSYGKAPGPSGLACVGTVPCP
jgi:hypothetical protein